MKEYGYTNRCITFKCEILREMQAGGDIYGCFQIDTMLLNRSVTKKCIIMAHKYRKEKRVQQTSCLRVIASGYIIDL